MYIYVYIYIYIYIYIYDFVVYMNRDTVFHTGIKKSTN